MNVFRTVFKEDIITEFVVPQNLKSRKALIVCSGMPSYPAKQKYLELFELFTKQGFFVFVPRYRGSFESGGKMFAKSPEEDIKDVMDGLEEGFVDFWSKKQYKIKNPQIILLGSSFGGPAVLLNSKDKRVKKVVATSPVIDWREEEKTVEPIDVLAPYVKNAFKEGYRIVGDGWRKIKTGNFYNPMTSLDKIDGKKCMVIHAKDDSVVSFLPVLPFCQKTKAQVILVKKGGHGLNILEQRFKKRTLSFLKLDQN